MTVVRAGILIPAARVSVANTTCGSHESNEELKPNMGKDWVTGTGRVGGGGRGWYMVLVSALQTPPAATKLMKQDQGLPRSET